MDYLLNVIARTLALAIIGGAAIWLLRLKSAAARHAVWTAVLAGMLLIALSLPVLPPLPLHVLRAERPATVAVAPYGFTMPSPRGGEAPAPHALTPAAAPVPVSPRRSVTWQEAALAVYAAGVLVFLSLLFSSYCFTGRLLRASRALDSELCESNWVAVPATVGMLHPKIVLPEGWRNWPPEKLAAVMAHERAHVRRGDWAITVIAGLNRSLFWFHPLAWWLERRLAALAEQCCDDASLLELGRREQYAQTLLDMAAAVKTSRGRMVWEAMAMAKTAEVRTRIERILDESRQIPRGLTRARWVTLVACGLPLLYLASAVHLAPAQQVRLTAQEVSQLEQSLAVNPDNLAVREQLIANYYLAGAVQPRLGHIFWLIANHPESDAAAFESAGVLNRNTPLNSTSDYDRAANLWRTEAMNRATDATVLGNAAHFFSQPGADPYEAERLLLQAAALGSPAEWTEKLGRLYAAAITAAEGYPRYDLQSANASFASHARTVLVSSSDMALRSAAAAALTPAALRPDLTRDAALARYPQLVPLAALSEQLSPRLKFQSNTTYDVARGTYTTQGAPAGPQFQVTVAHNIAADRLPVQVPVSSKTQESKLVQKATPVYPDAARSAGIEGDVRLDIVVGADGHVKRARPVDGNPLLAAAAQDAVMHYVYQPTIMGDKPVEVTTTLSVPFRLDGESASQASAAVPGANWSPVLLYKKEPAYTSQAIAAKLEGPVTLAFTIGTEGKPHNISVVSGLGMGLDEQAVEAVSQWKFKPASQDGTLVEAQTTATLNFHLLNSAPQTAAAQSAGTSAPVLIFKTEPDYSDAALRAKYQGTVVLNVTVAADGSVSNTSVLRSLGLGLDEKAVAAVKQWRFTPAYADGKAVEAATTVSVNFRLTSGAPQGSGIAEQSAERAAGSRTYQMVYGSDSGPSIISKVEPDYTEEARKAKFQGTVVLYVTVGTDGKAAHIQVQRSLGLGLDEKAIEAVKQWRFKPAYSQGKPVETATTLEVNFRLL